MKYVVSGELTTDKLREVINVWWVNERPKLQKLYNYYIGKQAILQKVYSDPTKPCNKIITNFCHQIVQQYLGFNVGVPVQYDVDDRIFDFLKWNDVSEKDNMMLRNALIYGKSYELQYIDDQKMNRFESIDTRYGVAIYGDELENDELKAFIRMYVVDNIGIESEFKWKAEVYDAEKVRVYNGIGDFSTLNFEFEITHNFGQVPVVVMELNNEQQGAFEQIMSLQDAYNTLMSSELDDWEAFVDAYMVIKGMTADDEDISKMKENRVLLMDTDSDASYLTKQVNDSQIQHMLDNMKELIFKMSNCPDFSDPTFMSDSGIALEYKLVGFNNVSKAMMNRMEKALRKRIELFTYIEDLKGDSEWRDATIVFTQNIPANTIDTAQTINLLRGLISNRTLISLLPFVQDVDKELEKIKEEKEAEFSFLTYEAKETEGVKETEYGVLEEEA